jgi:hypothetical protein
MLGEYYNDTVSIGGVALPNQTFAVARAPKVVVEGGLWGIMGLGPRRGSSAYSQPWSPVWRNISAAPAPVWEHLYENGIFRPKLFSVWLNEQDAKSGTILFGGIDESKFEGELKVVPIELSGGKEFAEWAVNLTSIARINGDTGDTEQLTNTTWSIRTIVDTGSPNMYLPTSIYDAIVAPLNVTLHPSASEPYVPCDLRSSHSFLAFSFPGKDGEDGPMIRAPYGELIYPFGLPERLGEVTDEDGTKLCYLGIIPNTGPIFLIGATVLRNAYVVFDAEKLEVRMAQARRGC